MAYIQQLEQSLAEANQRAADLERRMAEMRREHEEELRLEREYARVVLRSSSDEPPSFFKDAPSDDGFY